MRKRNIIIVISVCVVAILLYVFNMAYFSMKADFFPVQPLEQSPTGVLYADTVAKLMERELYGSGGWTPNDIPPSPTYFLDNKPNLQLGVLEVVRYSTRVLRDNLSRQRTTDKIDRHCDEAFTAFSNDPRRWIMPSAEGKYKKGVAALKEYMQSIKQEKAAFYPRSDNLIQLLEQYASLLGGVNTRLLNAARRNSEPPADAQGQEGAAAAAKREKVSWAEIDDTFYYAQGVGYGLYHMCRALQHECDRVLQDKRAGVIMEKIIRSLEESYFEPLVITNGSKDGIFANHCSNLRVFLDDARQKMNSLIQILDQG
jgi:hypothetical protein